MTPVDIRAAIEAFDRAAARFDACVDRLAIEAAELRRTNEGLAAIVQRGQASRPALPSPADRA